MYICKLNACIMQIYLCVLVWFVYQYIYMLMSYYTHLLLYLYTILILKHYALIYTGTAMCLI